MPHQLLLADDSVTIQRVIKLTFADEDVEVVTVGDGDQAVAAIDTQPPDIVLADVAMPGRSGYDVAQHIRSTPKLAHIPVLLLTGAFEPVDEARASAVGCDGVLAKPFEPDVVVSRVKELLARPRQASPKPSAVASAGAPSKSAAPVSVAAAPPQAPKPVNAPAPPPLVFPVKTPATATATATATAAPVAAAAPRQADVDAYFDRLDQAFATLALSPRAPGAAPQFPEASPAPAPVPVSVPVASTPAPPALTSQALADVFAGLTAVATPAAVAPTAPTPAAPPVPARAPAPAPFPQAVALTDAQLEQIVNRVLERLTARLGNPAEIVANVAERLVREEIAQIKSRL